MNAGWPLGLDNMNMRLQLMDTFEAASTRADTLDMPSISSSSFSSSDLNTESSRSFFKDHSMTLGRLIGIKPGEGNLYFPHQDHHEQQSRVSIARAASHASDRQEMGGCHGICIPLILCILVKANRGRDNSKVLKQAN
ncbi:hypothetical protein ACLOJK_010369 [Asimina triloba]